MSPIGLSSRRLLSQSTHVSVANSTSSRPRRPIVGDRRLPLLAPNGALQAHLAHQPLDGAAGCSDPLAMQLLPGLQATIYKGIFVMLRHLKGARVRKRRIIGAKKDREFRRWSAAGAVEERTEAGCLGGETMRLENPIPGIYGRDATRQIYRTRSWSGRGEKAETTSRDHSRHPP
jgi:hypothetical protein